MLERDFEF